ncbi:MAG: single-stranded DNA-binding protein [Halobacteriota archaeon]|nr:single-stranded DNA-binding protein [Halobacteriota archaeon]
MLNEARLLGRAGKDPETRFTGSQTKVVNFSLATSKKWTDQNGDQKESTQWHNIACWGKTADIAERYVSKGAMVLVCGEIQYHKWDDNDGNKRQRTDIKANRIFITSPKKSSNNNQNNQRSQPPDDEIDVPDDDFDDVPF